MGVGWDEGGKGMRMRRNENWNEWGKGNEQGMRMKIKEWRAKYGAETYLSWSVGSAMT